MLSQIYFCRHCLQVRCRECASHEVDSQYCQHCLEYIPTIDAKLKKNKCSVCYSCPSCGHTLSTRATITSVPSDTNPGEMVPKKNFYLVCFFCKWTSRDVGISDQSSASGPWPEKDSPHHDRIDDLYDYYKSLAQKEKMEKDKKRMIPKTGHALHLLDKYGISSALSPKVTETLRAQLYSKLNQPSLSPGSSKTPTTPNAQPSTPKKDLDDEDDFDEESAYNEEIDLNRISTIEQRLRQVEIQPQKVTTFFPVSQMLSVKRSLRCKTCDHNLSKPEYNPSSIKFKILLAAHYHIPEMKVKPFILKDGQTGAEQVLEITVANPTLYDLNISFDALLPPPPGYSVITNFDPALNVKIPPKDETLDIDLDLAGQVIPREQDDPRVITRRGNRVTIRLTFIPPPAGERIKLAILMRHDFVNSIIQMAGTEKRETQIQSVSQKVFITFPLQ